MTKRRKQQLQKQHTEQAQKVLNGEITPMDFIRGAMTGVLGVEGAAEALGAIAETRAYLRPLTESEKAVINDTIEASSSEEYKQALDELVEAMAPALKGRLDSHEQRMLADGMVRIFVRNLAGGKK